MAKYAIMPLEDYVDACAAVRGKLGTAAPIKSGDLGRLIRSIPTGGGGGGGGITPTGSLPISSNGTYNVTNYAQAVVNVPQSGQTQAVTITPSGQEIVASPDSGYVGFSQVTVEGDFNLLPRNIAAGVTIYGVTGTLEPGPSSTLPSEYDDFVAEALRRSGNPDHDKYFVAESAGWVSIVLMMGDFTVTAYSDETTEYSMSGAVLERFNKQTGEWSELDFRSTPSSGGNFVNNIRYSTDYLYYNGRIIYPMRDGPGSEGYTVIFMNENTVLQTVEHVPAGGHAAYTAATPEKEGYVFTGWNPYPVHIQQDTVCYAQFQSDAIFPEEIQDSWETVVQDAGAHYPIGAWKSMIILKDASDPSRGYDLVRMLKAAGGYGGTTSTWVSMDCFGSSSMTQVNWRNLTSLRAKLTGYMARFPEAVQNAITPTELHTIEYDGTVYRDTVLSDMVWIPSRKEVTGESSVMNNGIPVEEGGQKLYIEPLIKNDAFGGTPIKYWLRTFERAQSGNYRDSYYAVSETGDVELTPMYSSGWWAKGICFCFSF